MIINHTVVDGEVDAVTFGTGTGGTLSGTWEYFIVLELCTTFTDNQTLQSNHTMYTAVHTWHTWT